jgi:hypothetical protein
MSYQNDIFISYKAIDGKKMRGLPGPVIPSSLLLKAVFSANSAILPIYL